MRLKIERTMREFTTSVKAFLRSFEEMFGAVRRWRFETYTSDLYFTRQSAFGIGVTGCILRSDGNGIMMRLTGDEPGKSEETKPAE